MKPNLAVLLLTALLGCGGVASEEATNKGDLVSQETGKPQEPAAESTVAPKSRPNLLCDGTAGQTKILREGLFRGLTIVGESIVLNDDQAGIIAMPIAGGEVTKFGQSGWMSGAWVLGENVYFFNGYPTGETGPKGAISATGFFSMPLVGGEPTRLFDGNTYLTLTDNESLYFYDFGTKIVRFTPPATRVEIHLGDLSVTSLATTGDYLYATVTRMKAEGNTSSSTHSIIRVAKDGGAVTELVSGLALSSNLVADESGLYWTEEAPNGGYGPGRIGHAALDGTGVGAFVDQIFAGPFTLDADYLYAAALIAPGAKQYPYGTPESIVAVPKTGGSPIKLATGLEGTGDLVVAGGNVLWINLDSRTKSEERPEQIMLTCAPGAAER